MTGRILRVDVGEIKMDGVDGFRQCRVTSRHVTSYCVWKQIKHRGEWHDSSQNMRIKDFMASVLVLVFVVTFGHHVQPGPFREPFFQVLPHVELRDQSGLLPRQTGGVDHEDHRCGQMSQRSEGQLLHFVAIFSGPALQL